MANDLLGNLGGLGGLFKMASSFMPQDDPNVKVMNANQEIDELQKQEDELFIEIGKAAYSQNPSAFPQNDKLKLIAANIAAAKAKLSQINQENQAEKAAKEADEEARTCNSCGTLNEEGVKFCQECGARLGAAAKPKCVSCGAELQPGIKFCGECGARS